STFMGAGGYEAVQEILFNKINVHGYFMEYDDARWAGFEPLRMLPKGKQVVLGIVTTKTGRLESKDDLKRRIEEAARYAPFDQLCLSGQCGFASTEEGNVLTEDEQWAKLARIVEVAEEVWGQAVWPGPYGVCSRDWLAPCGFAGGQSRSSRRITVMWRGAASGLAQH